MMPRTNTAETSSGFRGLMRGPVGIGLALALGGAAVVYGFRSYFSGPKVVDTAERNFICAESGKPFAHKLQEGETLPVMSPYTNRPTGYPAERCYWTKDDKAKLEPTLVLLNTYIGKPEPTICPDCGREVRPHNPPPPASAFKEALEARKRGGQ